MTIQKSAVAAAGVSSPPSVVRDGQTYLSKQR